MKRVSTLLTICFTLFASHSAFSQETFLHLTLTETTNLDMPLAHFTYLDSTKAYHVHSSADTLVETDIHNALTSFLNILEPTKCYLIRHHSPASMIHIEIEYDPIKKDYLVLNKASEIVHNPYYFESFDVAKNAMLVLLKGVYSQN
jgi:hypothetical protein